jgi:NO-binding membrane sensor protein with MHYT domain
MEPEILIAIISSITAGISVIATYFFGVLNEKRNFELEYDKKPKEHQ